jgi:hypothetical protein
MKVELHLTDGRVLPLTAETIDNLLAQIAAHGVTPDLVAATIHITERSANREDLQQRNQHEQQHGDPERGARRIEHRRDRHHERREHEK